MTLELYNVADVFFFLFHTFLILFNTFGWLFKRVRIYNLITLLLTAFSWFVLGIWYGWGYCYCTDWHWSVRKKMGYVDYTDSYIDFLLIKLTNIDFPDAAIDTTTLVVFVLSLIISVFLNICDLKENKQKKETKKNL